MMTTITEVYDAFVSAGADDGKARRAAEVLADYENRFDRLEHRIEGSDHKIDILDRKIDTKFDGLRDALGGQIDLVKTELGGRINLLQWQLALLIGGVMAIVLKIFL